MVIFVGMETSEEQYREIQRACPPEWFMVHRASPEFIAWLAHADLSVSRAGYNTCADLLRTGTPSILLPSRPNRDQEPRARAFAEKGWSRVLVQEEVSVSTLAHAIIDGLRRATPSRIPALDGAARTAELIEQLGSVHRAHFPTIS